MAMPYRTVPTVSLSMHVTVCSRSFDRNEYVYDATDWPKLETKTETGPDSL